MICAKWGFLSRFSGSPFTFSRPPIVDQIASSNPFRISRRYVHTLPTLCMHGLVAGFGGRSEAGCGPARDSAGRTACSCGGPQTTPTPPITSVRSTDRKGGGEPAQTFAKQHGDPSAVAAAGRQGSSRWVVETDGDSAIGPEGKVTLRARFVAAPCSGRGGGGGGTSACGVCGVSEEWSSEKSGGSGSIGQVVPRPDVGDGVARGRPLLMLLRVSVVKDEAMALLGRRVSCV